MSTLDKQSVTQLENGLNRDHNFQKPGDATFVLNGIRDANDGGFAEYQSEPGNQNLYLLPANYRLIGSIYGTDNRVYLFSTNGTRSEVGVQRYDNYTTLINADFDFDSLHPITGEYRVRNHCNRTIYWSDGVNPDRWFDEDNPTQFQDGSGNWVVTKFNFTPIIIPPQIDLLRVNEFGGRLPSGTYQFQLQVLDKNENIIYTSDLSPQTPIFRDSSGGSYNSINGSLNIATTPDESGGEPITTKSITLQISGLDTNFEFIRFIVIAKTTNNEVRSAHIVGNLIPISAETITWTYVGFNTSNGDFETDVTETLVGNERYDSAYVMEQVDGRLLRANLKQNTNDYSTYQEAASGIVATWVSNEVPTKDQSQRGNAKNAETYWYRTSFQGDEIYAFGVRYLHSNGQWSPVFPLIGRPFINDDVEQLTVVDNTTAVLGPTEVWLSEVNHLGFEAITDSIGFGPGLVPRWMVYNTAIITSAQEASHPYGYEGLFGYYASTEEYPEIYNCEDQLVWGEDIIAGDKIRLFRFPDRRLIPHISDDGAYTRPLGVKFNNISYPSSDIVGHQFTYANRNDFNKTVVDCGWSYQPSSSLPFDPDTEATTYGYMIDSNDTETKSLMTFDSIKTVYSNALETFSYLKVNNIHKFSSNGDTAPPFATYELDNSSQLESAVMNAYHIDSISPARQNFQQDAQFLVLPRSRVTDPILPLSVFNSDPFTNTTVVELKYDEGLESSELYFPGQDITGDGGFGTYKLQKNNYYTYKKVNSVPYTNLLAQQYKYIHYNVQTSKLGVNNIYYNGDVLICENTLVRAEPNSVLLDVNSAGLSQLLTFVHHDMYVETQINSDLRIEGTNDSYKYFGYNDTDDYLISRVTIPSSITPNEYTKILPILWKQESYQYNSDYSLDVLQQAKLSLPLAYDYCSSCLGVFSNRIIFSPQSFDEESFDLYRINKTNDYIDLPAHRGEITGLQYKNSYLIVRTTETTFILRPQPQTLSTDQSSVYLTSGDFLSIKPQEIAQSDVGYAGMQSKLSEVNTPYGLYWADQKRGQVFRFTDKMEELSSPEFGLSQWFRDNLPSELDNAFLKLYNQHYPHNNTTTATKAVGVQLFYDPRYKRIFINKKDYKPTSLGDEITYSFFDDVFYFSSPENPIRLWDSVYFENRSFNISFSVDYNRWTSWHSYLPFYAFNDENFYYTLQESQVNRPYKHLHKQLYQRFYNSKKPFIVEFMIADMMTDRLNAIHYVGYTLKYEPLTKQYHPDDNFTFDKIMCYNSHQNTGLQTLTLQNQTIAPYQNITLPASSKYVIKTDNNYKVSGLYDMATTTPVVSSSWTDIQSTYPIDIVAKNISFTKSQYQWAKLRDKYLFVRLYLTTTQDVKKVINLIQTQESYSVR